MSAFIQQGPSTLFSNEQRLVLVILPWVAAFLSVFSSICILYTLFVDKEEKKPSPFRRILFASCIMDVLHSGPVVVMSGWGVPDDAWTSPWANGSVTSCNLMGVLILLGGAGQLLYSGFFALYHLLIVRYSWPTKRFVRRVEPYFHVASIAISIAWATLIFETEYINSSHLDPGICRASTNPPNCVHYEHLVCRRGHEWKSAHMVLSIVYVSLAVLVWTLMVVSHILIWLTVRATERRMRRYGHGSSRAASLSLTRKVGVQGMMYVGCFTSTNILSLIRVGILYQIYETSGANRRLYFGFQMLSLPLIQLQGFFHGIVFFRSRWKALLKPGRAWERLSKGQASPTGRAGTIEESGGDCQTDPTGRTDDTQETNKNANENNPER